MSFIHLKTKFGRWYYLELWGESSISLALWTHARWPHQVTVTEKCVELWKNQKYIRLRIFRPCLKILFTQLKQNSPQMFIKREFWPFAFVLIFWICIGSLFGVIFSWNNANGRVLILLEVTYPAPQSFLNITSKDDVLDTLFQCPRVQMSNLCSCTPFFNYMFFSFKQTPVIISPVATLRLVPWHVDPLTDGGALAFPFPAAPSSVCWHIRSLHCSGENAPAARPEEALGHLLRPCLWKHGRGLLHKQMFPGSPSCQRAQLLLRGVMGTVCFLFLYV